MTPSQNERSRASKLRKSKALGTIKPVDATWLAQYETRRVISKAKAKANAAAIASVRPRALPAPSPQPAVMHETQATTEAIAPDAATWIPEATPEQTEPLPDGSVPPAQGVPLVDEPPAPTGDPVAAKQFAAFVVLVTTYGFKCATELLADVETMPEEFRALAGSDELRGEVLGMVYAAAERTAIKHNFRSVPLGDEAVVAAALLGSGAIVLHSVKRKRLGSRKQPEAVAASAAPKAPASDIDAIFAQTGARV